MRKWKQLLAGAGLLTALTAIPSYAAGWQWMDPNNDGISECYYFTDNGTMLTQTTTPDGYTVNEQGAWIINGAVQTQEIKAQGVKSISSSPSSLDRHTAKTSQLNAFEYLLYTPRQAAENMPLIVFLHGHGTGELKNLKKDRYLTALCQEAEKQSGAYILAPLLPPELDYGAKGMFPGIEPSIMELIDSTADTYKIDRNRIYLMGCSMGADSAIQIAAAHPDTFACVVGAVPFHYQCPIAKWEDSWGEALKSTPVWLFVEDEGSAKRKAAAATDAIIAAGGQAWTEVLTGTDHGQATTRIAASMGTSQYGIYNWMLSVSR